MKIVNTYSPSFPEFKADGRLAKNRSAEVLAVLTQDDAGLYAVYVGLVPAGSVPALPDHAITQAVAQSGAKLPYNKVGLFFPHIPPNNYRA